MTSKIMGYSVLASCYDSMTPDVNYAKYSQTLVKLAKKYGCDPKIILDLACGTGSLSLQLAKAGYDVIGVDASYVMLSEATMKNA
ncbi:MAG: methyltransferase domain-containing protein, partial [Clostridia bacterium]|nr:methyltransferase domain-containing protein [Clostridia bacterium]